MAQIGTFKRTKTGFSGQIRTLALDAKLILVPVAKSDAAPHPHIGRNPTVDCAHVRLPISPDSNRHMIGIRATCRAVHRCSSRGLPAVPRAERRDRSGAQISER